MKKISVLFTGLVLFMLITLASASFLDDIVNALTGCQTTQAGGRICFSKTTLPLAIATPQTVMKGSEIRLDFGFIDNIANPNTGQLYLYWDVRNANTRAIVDDGFMGGFGNSNNNIFEACYSDFQEGRKCTLAYTVRYDNINLPAGNYIMEAVVVGDRSEATTSTMANWLAVDSGYFTVECLEDGRSISSASASNKCCSGTRTECSGGDIVGTKYYCGLNYQCVFEETTTTLRGQTTTTTSAPTTTTTLFGQTTTTVKSTTTTLHDGTTSTTINPCAANPGLCAPPLTCDGIDIPVVGCTPYVSVLLYTVSALVVIILLVFVAGEVKRR